MPKHVKPTKEELEAQTQAAIKEAEKLKDAPVVEEEEPVVEPPKETPEEEPVVEPEPPAPAEEEPQAEPSEEEKEALKKKLFASARENQKIYAKNRVINKALLDADEMPEPTEEELLKEFSQWEDMTETEKTLAKETVISRNWRKKISEAKEQATKIEKWNESVEAFVDDPKTLVSNPDLEGKTDEFKTFATEETNNSVPFNILVSAFLHQHSASKKPNKGKMFEHGSGGPNDKPQPKSDKLSLEESRKLRENNYPKWKEMLDAGKIEFDL